MKHSIKSHFFPTQFYELIVYTTAEAKTTLAADRFQNNKRKKAAPAPVGQHSLHLGAG